MKLHLDFETRSTADLRKVGAHKYAADPSTDIWCAAWAIDDEEVQLVTPYTDYSIDFFNALQDAETIVAHNAAFERAICRSIMTPRYDWPEIPLKKWRCTMAMAYAMGLPGSLDDASAALGMSEGKDREGHRLMLSMCKPRRPHKDEARDPQRPFVYWRDDEVSRKRLYQYCINDVIVERALEKRLLPLSKAEQEVWFLDQRINDRGVCIDREMCKQAIKIVDDALVPLNKEMRRVTDGQVTSAANAVQLTNWLRSLGVQTDSVAKDVVDSLLTRDDLPADCRRALELRQECALSSVKKFAAFSDCALEDGRARGLLQYHAAGTGRWAGRRVQPQNFKRPGHDEEAIDEIIEEIFKGDHRRIGLLFGSVIPAVSDCVRGAIKAAPDHQLIVADLSNIESRVLAWLAGEDWKLEAFRQFDAGRGEDIYKIAYADCFGVLPWIVTKAQRQIGKPIELAHGYEGGPGSFVIMSKTYGVDISKAFNELVTRFPNDAERAFEAWKYRGNKSGMWHSMWCAAEIVKIRWRRKNVRIVQFWKDIKSAAIDAVRAPGVVTFANVIQKSVKFIRKGSFLFMQLPSGRVICLPYPEVKAVKTPWGSDDVELSFMTIGQYSRKWERTSLYGGKLANYATQGTARDVMVNGMLAVEAAGYPIVLTIHDEVVAEILKRSCGDGILGWLPDAENFSRIIATPPKWAPDLPLAANGFQAERYKK
jgi:DNA polymerase bacteriophage-type